MFFNWWIGWSLAFRMVAFRMAGGLSSIGTVDWSHVAFPEEKWV